MPKDARNDSKNLTRYSKEYTVKEGINSREIKTPHLTGHYSNLYKGSSFDTGFSDGIF
jgi:hypothetical protein